MIQLHDDFCGYSSSAVVLHCITEKCFCCSAYPYINAVGKIIETAAATISSLIQWWTQAVRGAMGGMKRALCSGTPAQPKSRSTLSCFVDRNGTPEQRFLVLVLGAHYPACFRCFAALTHPIQVDR